MRPVTSYSHTQTDASTLWTIVHNLGSYPIVDVYTTADDASVQKILPAGVSYVDANTVQVTFTSARAGFATVVA